MYGNSVRTVFGFFVLFAKALLSCTHRHFPRIMSILIDAGNLILDGGSLLGRGQFSKTYKARYLLVGKMMFVGKLIFQTVEEYFFSVI